MRRTKFPEIKKNKNTEILLKETIKIKGPLSEKYVTQLKREAERFAHKFLYDEEKARIFMGFVSPFEFTMLLKIALEDGMEFTWEDEK